MTAEPAANGGEAAQYALTVADLAAGLDREVDIAEPGQFRIIAIVALLDEAEGGPELETGLRPAAKRAEDRQAKEF